MKPKVTRRDFLCITAMGMVTAMSTASLAQGRRRRRRMGQPLVLAEKGKTRYQIVIPEKASPSEKYSAEELARYLKKITGAEFPIVPDSGGKKETEILIGRNHRLSSENITIDWRQLRPDGYILRTVGNRLLIAGDPPRGTLYGVYCFLEEHLGCRWFTPEVEQIPQKSRLEVPALNVKYVPPLEYREVFWTECMRNADFAARHRLNGNHYPLEDRHGGRAVVYYPFVHSFDLLIPPKLYDTHPEYFPLINGQRVKGYVQRCLSNPEVVKLAKERVRQWLKEHPEATIISVSQNDTFNYCQCEKCKALDEAEGSPSASVIHFVNQIAEDIEKDYPHVRIDTLAYQYTRKPPRTLRPRHNVIIRLCSIECCFAHPLASCPSEENRRFREDASAWKPVAPLLYVWDYTTNFSNYLQPFPNFRVLQDNVRFFIQHNVKGIFEQGNYSPGGNGEMAPLRAYLLSKILWNPDTQVEKHMEEFLQGYYGKSAELIRAYIDLLQRQVEPEGRHAHIFDNPKAPYLTEELIQEGERLWEEAERVADNEEVRRRVQIARLPITYVRLVTNRVPPGERQAVLDHFLQVARSAGITHISEGRRLEDWEKQMRGG